MKVISRSSTRCSKLPELKTAKRACAPSWRKRPPRYTDPTMPTGRFRKEPGKKRKIANDDGFASPWHEYRVVPERLNLAYDVLEASVARGCRFTAGAGRRLRNRLLRND